MHFPVHGPSRGRPWPRGRRSTPEAGPRGPAPSKAQAAPRARCTTLASVLGALLALLAYAFAFQGSRGLCEPDEGHYTEVALEMLRLGDTLVPMLNHEHPTTPSRRSPAGPWPRPSPSAGPASGAARAPNVLAFAATVLLLALLGRRQR